MFARFDGFSESGGSLMSVASSHQDLYAFAVELRQLAYTMPGGHEDPLIRLSERMVRYARQHSAEDESPPGRIAT
jgi:hypothetical protein